MAYDERDLYTGLATLAWSAYDDPDWDHDFYKQVIEKRGGKALDVGCGAGRLLRLYLKAGLDVEGCDISGEMLAVCRSKAAAEGLQPVLYEQPMQRLDLPQRYNTIYIPCGSFMCVMDPGEALEALRRFRDHLLPGGTLAFNTYLEKDDRNASSNLPSAWQPHDTLDFPENGERLVIERKLMHVDPLQQIVSEKRRYRMYRKNHLIKEETHRGQYRWYSQDEVLHLLEKAGFESATVTGDYTDKDFDPERHETMVLVASKENTRKQKTVFCALHTLLAAVKI